MVTDDLFVVRGYAIPRADAAVNLQSGFSPDDAAQLGWATGWASPGCSSRPGTRPTTTRSGSAGACSCRRSTWRSGARAASRCCSTSAWAWASCAPTCRAAVPAWAASATTTTTSPTTCSSATTPTDWLYLQYRTGLRTFDNRRGVVVDNTRLTRTDASTHNFAVVARHHGLTAGLYYFINLEKVDEVPNDLLRLSVTYEF